MVAVVPAFPGCHSQGETAEEALSNAREAILLTIEDMRERGDAIPDPAGGSYTAWLSERKPCRRSRAYRVERRLARSRPSATRSFDSEAATCEYDIRPMHASHSPCQTMVNSRTGLLRALIRDAGMTVEEFVEALRR